MFIVYTLIAILILCAIAWVYATLKQLIDHVENNKREVTWDATAAYCESIGMKQTCNKCNNMWFSTVGLPCANCRIPYAQHPKIK